MHRSWMAIALAVAVCGCGGQSSAGDKAHGAYETALSTCGSDDKAHSAALQDLIKLERAHPKDAAVADAFLKAYRYEAQHGC